MPNPPKKSDQNILNQLHQSIKSSPSDQSKKTIKEHQLDQKKPKKLGRFNLKFPRLPKLSPKVKIALGVLLIILAIFGTTITATAIPLLRIKQKLPQVQASISTSIAAAKSQDLVQAKQSLDETKSTLQQIQSSFKLLSWYRYTPLKEYYLDGDAALNSGILGVDAAQTLLAAVEPYADVLGLKGEGTFTGGTAQDRILKIIGTLGKVTPELAKVLDQLEQIETQLDQIDPNRYQFEFQGQQVDQVIVKGKENLSEAKELIASFKPILEVLPQIAGLQEEQKYLVIFQNDAEIRPTGGFMTAYGVIRIDKGTVYQEKSDDIYELDQKFNSRIQPPEPIQKYLPLVYYWYLRDMNLDPDFKLSMDQFLEHYQEIPGEPDNINGVIAVDTQVLSNLIRVLGDIEVPGFGKFSADIDERCNCPQVIYELEDFATRPVAYVRDDRKAFLVPMMQALIQKAYSAPSEIWPNLFQTVIRDVQQKHVLLYMFNPDTQAAVELAGFGGRIKEFHGDYLHINDTNFGGAKSNLFIQEEIEDKITTSDSGTQHALTVTYKNPAPASNCNLEAGKLCLNGTYRDWVRFYLPLGTTLQDSIGFEEDTVETYEEKGKTVIEGFFEFQPQSQAKLRLTYTTPYVMSDKYEYMIQKQPGKKAPSYTLIFNDVDKQEFDLITDKVITFEP